MISAVWYGDAITGGEKERKMGFVIAVLVVVALVFVIVYLANRT